MYQLMKISCSVCDNAVHDCVKESVTISVWSQETTYIRFTRHWKDNVQSETERGRNLSLLNCKIIR